MEPKQPSPLALSNVQGEHNLIHATGLNCPLCGENMSESEMRDWRRRVLISQAVIKSMLEGLSIGLEYKPGMLVHWSLPAHLLERPEFPLSGVMTVTGKRAATEAEVKAATELMLDTWGNQP